MPRHYRGPDPNIGSKAHSFGNEDRHGIHSAHTVKSSKIHKSQAELERQFSDLDKPTDYEEVWFSGVHCGMYGRNSMLNAMAELGIQM